MTSQGELKDLLDEFRHREFLAWYNDHVETSMHLDTSTHSASSTEKVEVAVPLTVLNGAVDSRIETPLRSSPRASPQETVNCHEDSPHKVIDESLLPNKIQKNTLSSTNESSSSSHERIYANTPSAIIASKPQIIGEHRLSVVPMKSPQTVSYKVVEDDDYASLIGPASSGSSSANDLTPLRRDALSTTPDRVPEFTSSTQKRLKSDRTGSFVLQSPEVIRKTASPKHSLGALVQSSVNTAMPSISSGLYSAVSTHSLPVASQFHSPPVVPRVSLSTQQSSTSIASGRKTVRVNQSQNLADDIVRGSTGDTQPSIFSVSRMERSLSMAVPKMTHYDSPRYESLPHDRADEDGWDEIWSSQGIDLLGCDYNSDSAALAKVAQTLVNGQPNEELPSHLANVFLRVAVERSELLSEALAPSLIRLKRRCLHRASQNSATQTVAAPVSALEWMSRMRQGNQITNSTSSLLFAFGYFTGAREGVGKRAGRRVLELNVESTIIKNCTAAVHCGWMTRIEHVQANRRLEKMLADFSDKYELVACHGAEQVSFDSINVMYLVESDNIARAMANRILTFNGHEMWVKEFPVGHPLLLRLLGSWTPGFEDVPKHVVLDVKFVLKSREDAWVTEIFCSKPIDQLREILRFTFPSLPSRVESDSCIGVHDLIAAVKVIQAQEPNVATWDQILEFMAKPLNDPID